MVVSVIAMLTALLLPALGKARDTAKTIYCAGNLKQVGICFESYACDWNNYCLPVSSGPDARSCPLRLMATRYELSWTRAN